MVPSDRYWAKIESDTYHPLFAHCADVAAVLERLTAPGTVHAARLAAAAGLPELQPRHHATLVYLAALHDVGKANHGFQEKMRTTPQMPARGHVKILLQTLTHPLLRPAAAAMARPLELSGQALVEMLIATIAHHGRPWELEGNDTSVRFFRPQAGIPRDPVTEILGLAELAHRHSGLAAAPPSPPLEPTPALTHLFAALLTLADWLGSNESVFRFEPDAEPEDYWPLAQSRAAEICARTGAVGRVLQPCAEGVPLLRKLFPSVFANPDRPGEPSPLQARMADMPLPGPGARLLVESETGSGKTEAAIALYSRLRTAGRVDGLLFALPTRATATAMFTRVTGAVRALYGNDAPHVVLAVGGTQPTSGGNASLDAEPQRHDDDGAGTGLDPLTRWASESARRYLAAEIVVGTLDQVLLAGLPVRYAHLRLAGLARHLLVVDELHAYDPYMTRLLANLLDLHTGMGGVALFMSATLAASARGELGGPPEPPLAEAERRPYPLLAVGDPSKGWQESGLDSASRPKRVRWRRCDEAEWLLPATEAATAGGRVCVLRNTVSGARASVQALVASGFAPLLWTPRAGSTPAYHSRYAPPDRAVLDHSVLAHFGRGVEGPGMILVATQVAEQSLDVDFDLLVTDLAPVDVLLQRIGRLWRHPERRRPTASVEARAWVIGPVEGFEERLDKNREHGPNGWGPVYDDLAVLELTLRLVGRTPQIEIPRDNRGLVEGVYHQESRSSLGARWDAYAQEREGKQFATVGHAQQSALRFGDSYRGTTRQFDEGQEKALRTRLGDDRVRIPLAPYAVPCRYRGGVSVDWMELPSDLVDRGRVDPAAPEILDWRSGDDGVRFRIGRIEVVYDDAGWQWSMARD